jgi:ABC-type glycerol-3-phosphate transport system substrate-binding protein
MQRVNWLKVRQCELAQLTLLFGLMLAVGCSGAAGQSGEAPPKPRQGTTLKLACADERLRGLITPLAQVWANQTGAKVTVSASPMQSTDDTDLAIIPFAELGLWADRGDLTPVPAAIREPGNPYQWLDLLLPYRGELFAGWGNQIYGLPLAGEGQVIVYRADRFSDAAIKDDYRKKYNRALGAPATWEEFADIAAFFAERDKKPSLPSLADSVRLEDLFFHIAACYDRPVQSGDALDNPQSLAFHFRLDTGKPRIDGRGFVEAGKWLASLKSRSAVATDGAGDVAAALNNDRAVLAVASLSDLSRLKREQIRSGRFGIAALPGTKGFVRPSTGQLVASPSNMVPYLSGGWLGVVRASCTNKEAAFALLTELTGPVRSQEIIAAGGYGPVRESHLEAERLLIWLGYGFDEQRTRTLQEALRANLGKSVRNPAYGLRTPDEGTLRSSLRKDLAQIASESISPEDGLKQAATAWDADLPGTPREKRLEWRRRAAGLN